jgi:uncharacterized protein
MTAQAGQARWLQGALLALVLLAALLPVAAPAQELVPVPQLRQRVTDLAQTLSPDQRAQLEQKLAAFEQARGTQIAVLLVPTTQPEAIEEYAIRVADAWKIGRRDVGDGLLVLVAKQDRAMRIEVARALEGAVPDALAKRVIAETMAPQFKQGDFYGGLDHGLDQLFRLIEGEGLPAPSHGGGRSGGGIDIGQMASVVMVLAVVLGSVLRALLGAALGAGIAAALIGGAAWLISGSLLIGLIAALVGFVFVLIMGSGGGRGGGLTSRGGWHGGGGGWNSGGGGWSSGGGGSFGGGGASGRW